MIRVGDVLCVEGHFEERDTIIVVVAVIVVFVFDDVVVDWEEWEDWDCKNPPPPWAPAHGWRRKCGDGFEGGEDDDDDD